MSSDTGTKPGMQGSVLVLVNVGRISMCLGNLILCLSEKKKKKSRNKKNLCSFVFWFDFVKSKDDKLMLDFSMLCFRDCHKMDKMQSVWIRSRLRWLNSQEMQKSFKSKLKYLLVTCKSSYHSKNGFYI